MYTNMNSVSVRFSTSATQTFDYLVPNSWNVQVGDNLVIMDPRNNLVVVEVVHLDRPIRSGLEYKRAVSHLIMDEWEEWEANRLEIREVRRAIADRSTEVRRTATDSDLSFIDPELNRLLLLRERLTGEPAFTMGEPAPTPRLTPAPTLAPGVHHGVIGDGVVGARGDEGVTGIVNMEATERDVARWIAAGEASATITATPSSTSPLFF